MTTPQDTVFNSSPGRPTTDYRTIRTQEEADKTPGRWSRSSENSDEPKTLRPKRPRRDSVKQPVDQRKLVVNLPEGVYDSRPRLKRYFLHWLYFWLYAWLRLYKVNAPIPRATVREQLTRGFATLFELAKTRRPIIACVNSKGGAGKTVIATWIAVLIKLATHRAVYIVDANENKGNTASRLGISRTATVLLRAFLRFEKELSTADSINDALASHVGSGVLVVGSDADKKSYFTQELFERRMRTLHQEGHTTVLDVGNGIPHAANRGSVAIADVVVTPATVMQADSFEDAEDTRIIYSSTDRYYGFGDKMAAGVIPLLGVTEKERTEFIEQYGWKPEKVFRIPKDKYMVRRHVVNWRKIRLRTQLALVNVAIEIYNTAPVVTLWDASLDQAQHVDELDLTEVQYTHEEANDEGGASS